jgi:pimeloyl-ACP methyl ester carboxylesterase
MTAGSSRAIVFAALAATLAMAAPAHASHSTRREPPSPPVAPGQCVVVLHGMARSRQYMHPLELDLKKVGYTVVNESYPTRKETIEQLAARVDGYVQRCRDGGAMRIHFVTHSLGGLVARYWLRDHALPEAGRFVMLGTPNRGSEITDRFRDQWWYRISTGPAGQQIGTEADSLPNRLGPPSMETGVIAGVRAANDEYTEWLGGPNDGKVSVASTQMAGLCDYLMVDNSHYFLPRAPAVLRQVRTFLETGRFEHEGASRSP